MLWRPMNFIWSRGDNYIKIMNINLARVLHFVIIMIKVSYDVVQV